MAWKHEEKVLTVTRQYASDAPEIILISYSPGAWLYEADTPRGIERGAATNGQLGILYERIFDTCTPIVKNTPRYGNTFSAIS